MPVHRRIHKEKFIFYHVSCVQAQVLKMHIGYHNTRNNKTPATTAGATKKEVTQHLINKIVSQRDLKVTKQLIGIADHADALADGKVCHLGHYLFIHVAGKISI